MPLIPGSVRFTGFAAPTDDTDTYPVTDPVWGLGSLRTVADTTERDAISTARREEGMLVYVVSDKHYYKLESDLTTWTDFGTSISDSNILAGVTCDSGVAVGDVVRMASSVAQKAQGDSLANSKAVGIVESKQSSTSCTVRFGGISAAIFSGLSEGERYRISTTSAGAIQATNVSISSGFHAPIGIAFSSTRLIVNIGTIQAI